MTGLWKAALIGGLATGALDIAVAGLVFGASPLVVLQSVATGLYGPAAYHGGAPTMVVGALCQESISVVAALLYCLAALRFPRLVRRWIVYGILYGAACNLVMTFIVIPLSHAHPIALGSHGFWVDLAVNTLLYGTPIALAARRWLRSPQ